MLRLPAQSYGIATLKGEFRLRLCNEGEFARLRKKHPDWPREYILALCTDDDTGWVKNTVTDMARRWIGEGGALTTNLDIFIHEGTAPGSVDCNALQFLHPDQTGSAPAGQVASPINLFDMATLLQTRTVTFGVPNTQRDINMVGLTFRTAVDVTLSALFGIAAYSVLSSTKTQTTVQTADVQYKLTWSFE